MNKSIHTLHCDQYALHIVDEEPWKESKQVDMQNFANERASERPLSFEKNLCRPHFARTINLGSPQLDCLLCYLGKKLSEIEELSA